MDQRGYPRPGLIILFGSGETSPTGRKIFEPVFRLLPPSPRVALLETPAGFELNSNQVINRVGDFFTSRLQNYSPRVDIIPARMRGTSFSPDDPAVVGPMLFADLIFMGPGSPTYAVRQLRKSLAWYYLLARHQLGAVLALASAACVAVSAYTLPVYEIYKAGEDIHWKPGLDFFQLYGLKLVFIPHWNNNEGGVKLDTSRCFIGQERFSKLLSMLPKDMIVIGLDEKTALIIDPMHMECQVRGLGNITVIHSGHKHHPDSSMDSVSNLAQDFTRPNEDPSLVIRQEEGQVHQYHAGDIIPLAEFGPFHPCIPGANLPPQIWQIARTINNGISSNVAETPPDEII
ncbi:MAG: hypothetical protein ACM3H7_08835, partial [Acidobacteriaceae bacterium]